MRLTMGPVRLIVQGMRPEEAMWGPYQFPRPFRLKGRIAVAVHVDDDSIKAWGAPSRWFESQDEGETWHEVDSGIAAEYGLPLPNGDRIYFPMESGKKLDGYRIPDFTRLTPGYDFSRKAEEGTLPMQDGVVCHLWGTTIRAYNADRLPPSLDAKEWDGVADMRR